MLSQTLTVTNRLQDVGKASVSGSSWPVWGPDSHAASPQRRTWLRVWGGGFRVSHQAPLAPSSGGVGPEVAEKPGLCTETQPQAQPQLTFLLHLTSSSHFLLSHSFSNSLGGPSPVCVFGGVTSSSLRLFLSTPVSLGRRLLPPPLGQAWVPVLAVMGPGLPEGERPGFL